MPGKKLYLCGLLPLIVIAAALGMTVRTAWQQATPRVTATPPGSVPRLTALEGVVRLDLAVAPATFGGNRFLISVRDTRGRSLDGLTVQLRPTMPLMAMTTQTLVAQPVGAGRYQAAGLLAMPGSWQVDATVRGRGVPSGAHVRFTLQVGATQRPMPPLLPILGGQRAASTTPVGTVGQAPASWAGLPYRALVTFLATSDVYLPARTTLLRAGLPGTGINHSLARVPGRDEVWVTDYGDNRVAVIDVGQQKLVATIPVGLGPVHVVFDRAGTRAWVTDFLSNEVTVIDVARRKVLRTIQLGLHPHGLALSPDGKELWVAESGVGSLAVLDTRTNTLVAQVPAGIGPHAVAFSPDGRTVYMTDYAASGLVLLDYAKRSILGSVHIGTGSAMDAVTPDGRYVYVTGQSGSVVSVVETARRRVVARIPVGQAPHGLAFTPDARYLYVAVNNANRVVVIDTRTNTVMRTVAMPGPADELVLWP
jgi:YVTN family beta-propeller protein